MTVSVTITRSPPAPAAISGTAPSGLKPIGGGTELGAAFAQSAKTAQAAYAAQEAARNNPTFAKLSEIRTDTTARLERLQRDSTAAFQQSLIRSDVAREQLFRPISDLPDAPPARFADIPASPDGPNPDGGPDGDGGRKNGPDDDPERGEKPSRDDSRDGTGKVAAATAAVAARGAPAFDAAALRGTLGRALAAGAAVVSPVAVAAGGALSLVSTPAGRADMRGELAPGLAFHFEREGGGFGRVTLAGDGADGGQVELLANRDGDLVGPGGAKVGRIGGADGAPFEVDLSALKDAVDRAARSRVGDGGTTQEGFDRAPDLPPPPGLEATRPSPPREGYDRLDPADRSPDALPGGGPRPEEIGGRQEGYDAADPDLVGPLTLEARPTHRQSEIDVGEDLGPDALPQRSYKDGVEVPWSTAGSVRPDFIFRDNAAFEVKNYDIAKNASGLSSTVARQAIARAQHLPASMRQQIVIDIRDQSTTLEQRSLIVDDIVRKSNNIIDPTQIEFKR